MPKLKAYAGPQREQSFQVGGPRLFNSPPTSLRNVTKCTVEEFKTKADKFMAKLPDEPHIGGLIPAACDQLTAALPNSIPDQIRRMDLGAGS